MKRIIIDTQSNRLFQGIPAEQVYDQRGGLCEVGVGHIVITAQEIDPDFLDYWTSLGLSLPTMLTAGPFSKNATLSELIMQRRDIREALDILTNGAKARLEFFCIEESERLLTQHLGIPAYCNFDVAIPLSRKPAFRRFFDEQGLSCPPGMICSTHEDLRTFGAMFLDAGKAFLVKSEDGTGGVGCDGLFRINSWDEFLAFLEDEHDLGREFVVEEQIAKRAEVSVHWEIDEYLTPHLKGIFNQHAPDFGYAGTSWPPTISKRVQDALLEDLASKWWPALTDKVAIGFFCCDVLIDERDRHYWIDFNPRKGAIRYVYCLSQRLADRHFGGVYTAFLHEHIKLSDAIREKIASFADIRNVLADLLIPNSQTFIVITNPGVIPYGYADITCITSSDDQTESRRLFEEAKRRLLSTS